LQQHPNGRCLKKAQDQIQGAVDWVARGDDLESRKQHDGREDIKKDGSDVHGNSGVLWSAVFGVSRLACRNLWLIPVANSEQHLFGEIQVAALFAVVLEYMGFDNGVDRAAFFTKTAKNTFG
jgi:hypothetical protein